MEKRESSLYKPIYSNSLLKVKDIVYVLVVMLLVLPLMLHQGNKEISVFSLMLLTSLLIIIIIIGENILRKYSLKKLKSFDFENTSKNQIPTFMKYIVMIFIALGLLLIIIAGGFSGVLYVALITLAMYLTHSFYNFFCKKILPIKYPKLYADYQNNHTANYSSTKFISYIIIAILIILIMSYGVIGVLAFCSLSILLKICLVFIPNLFIAYLISFRSNFYNYYKSKSLDFKISYTLNIFRGIEVFILPLLITFILSDIETVLGINDFFSLNLETVLIIMAVIILLILNNTIIKRLELNAIKIHNEWNMFINDYSKKIAGVGFFMALIILLIFITSDLGGFG